MTEAEREIGARIAPLIWPKNCEAYGRPTDVMIKAGFRAYKEALAIAAENGWVKLGGDGDKIEAIPECH